ncbi:hypothetical protein [Stenotrophomonas indicatrix]|nr:hypothetical protein [Stenotrophomonas indicatrix]
MSLRYTPLLLATVFVGAGVGGGGPAPPPPPPNNPPPPRKSCLFIKN